MKHAGRAVVLQGEQLLQRMKSSQGRNFRKIFPPIPPSCTFLTILTPSRGTLNLNKEGNEEPLNSFLKGSGSRRCLHAELVCVYRVISRPPVAESPGVLCGD